MQIDFLAVGNVTRDIAPEGFRLGGTVSFAAVTARRLGCHPGILTRAALDGLVPPAESIGPAGLQTSGLPGTPLADIPIHVMPSPVTTTFANIYRESGRVQVIQAIADPVTPEGLPPEWADTPVVLLGPIAREIPAVWAGMFPRALLGITPQGLMRRWDEAGHVAPGPWDDAEAFLARADAVILSREDVGGDDARIGWLAARARLLVVTDGWHGATVYQDGIRIQIPPRPAVEVDPTGAGDVFATAFLVRYAETSDPQVAARFANVVASMSVEAPGQAGIPLRATVEAWLQGDEALGKTKP